ncbi:MAG: hydantoin utilization protein A [Gammaproteobacteria bacterium]
MTSLLLLGFVLGMRHAIEADHVAAVASLATRSPSVRHTVFQGAAWGMGHTLTLTLFGSVVLLLDSVMPERFASMLELAVGMMLIALGIDVLYRLHRKRVHFHSHRHGGDVVHFHAHSHPPEERHDPQHHQHTHPSRFPLRALLVGLMHGMAGSAALILLTLQHVRSVAEGMGYIALFGIGSIAGMAALSVVIAVPLRYSARKLTWLHNGLQAGIGAATLALGAHLVIDIALIEGTIW